MKTKIFLTLLVTIVFATTSCNPTKNIVGKNTGFYDLPFPGNYYKPGQIIEVYTKPRKVEISHKTNIDSELFESSKGWNISTTSENNIKSNISAQIYEIVKGKYSFNSKENIKVEFTNTETTIIPKKEIYGALEKEISNDKVLRNMLEDVIKNGVYFEVITATLSADIKFSIVNSSNQELELDPEILEEINSKLNVDFSKSSNKDTEITGKSLVVGIYKDRKPVTNVMNRLKE